MLKFIARLAKRIYHFIGRYWWYLPATAFEHALFDSVRYTVRRFFSTHSREIAVHGAT